MTGIHLVLPYSGLTTEQFELLAARNDPIFMTMMRNRFLVTYQDGNYNDVSISKMKDWCIDNCRKFFYLSDVSYGKFVVYFEDEKEAVAFRVSWHGHPLGE